MSLYTMAGRNSIRDSQKGKVYAWERANVAPHDVTPVPFTHIQNIVNYVWQREGLQYPPTVEPMPKQKTTAAADATRTIVRFHESTYTWIILHELAHSMTSTFDHDSNWHGALFMGVYIQLLRAYLNLDYGKLVDSAAKAKLHVKMDARPVFI